MLTPADQNGRRHPKTTDQFLHPVKAARTRASLAPQSPPQVGKVASPGQPAVRQMLMIVEGG
jgi:hypothetical protein